MIISSITPFVAFWILILVGRSELGLKGVLSCVAIWVGLFLGFMYLDLSSYFSSFARRSHCPHHIRCGYAHEVIVKPIIVAGANRRMQLMRIVGSQGGNGTMKLAFSKEIT